MPYIKYNKIIFLLLTLSSICLGVNPEKEYPYSPKQFGILNYDSIVINTSDGYKLVSWKFSPCKNDKKTLIVIAYGDGGNMSYTLSYVKKLLESGFSVITFDYRGFGKSDSFLIKKNYLYHSEFVEDLKSVLKYSKNNYSNYKIGIMSFSMGTIISTFALQDYNVNFMISENYVTNPDSVVNRILQTKNKVVLMPKQENNYTLLLNNIKCPVLFFAGTKDQTTTLNDVLILAKKNKKFIVKKYNGGHGQGLLVLTKKTYGDIYFETIAKFIKQNQ